MNIIKSAFVFAVCFLCAGLSSGQNFNGNSAYPMEFSIYGGVSSSDTEKEVNGVKADFGGGGFSAGFTGLGFINDYFAAGLDFSYSNDGYGKSVDLGGTDTDFRLERYRPLFLTKVYFLPPAKSKISLYAPLGVGLEFARISKRESNNNDDKLYDTLAGFALTAGLGVEFNFRNNTFIAFEGRYNWARFIGSNDYDITHAGGFSGAVKLGMRFNSYYDFWD
ncbi:MAG: outer membrane beta-barrel protein [Elusimicrobia bacterium]|nr:outer membrane beta-barrel protein [Elusimicrobiota bacterium]